MTSRGVDRLTFLGHATTLVRLGGTAVITDPVIRGWIGPLRRQNQAPGPEPLASADAVVLSHLHRDHLDLGTLRRLPPATPVIVPRGAGSLVAKTGASEVLEVTVGDEISIGEVTITAVPASHDPRRDRWGVSAMPLGYVIGSSRRRVYFAGDTGLFREMADLRPLDLALLPVWGWGPRVGPGHLDPSAAASALTLLRPRLAVPIHWGTFYPLGMARIRPGPLSEPPLEFARLARELSPEVLVRVLEPGSDLALDPEDGS